MQQYNSRFSSCGTDKLLLCLQNSSLLHLNFMRCRLICLAFIPLLYGRFAAGAELHPGLRLSAKGEVGLVQVTE